MFDAIKIGKEKKVKHVLSDNGSNAQHRDMCWWMRRCHLPEGERATSVFWSTCWLTVKFGLKERYDK